MCGSEVCFIFFGDCVLSLTHIQGMHKSSEECNKLLEATTSVLGEEALQMLLISAQEANVALCMKYAVQEWVCLANTMP